MICASRGHCGAAPVPGPSASGQRSSSTHGASVNLDLTGAGLSAAARAAWAQFNDTAVPVASRTVLDDYIRSVRSFPGNPAVADEAHELSYRQLDAASDAGLAALRAAGVRAGDCVGVVDGRCVRTYVAVLAAIKAGATFVPLDPRLPAQRFSSMVAQRPLSAVVVPAGSTRPAFPAGPAGCPVVEVGAQPPGVPVPVEVARPRGEDLAYIIHTSGSTGTPKGVCIRHDSLENLSAWMMTACPVQPGDHLAQMSPLYFDPAMQQIFPAWAAGACLIPVPLDLLLEPVELAAWLRRRGITHLDLVTPHWASLLTAYESAPARVELPDLRWFLVGGESMHYEQVRRWHAAVGGPGQLLNVYGPTEATVNATTFLVDHTQETGKVPIGTPLPKIGRA